MSATSSILPEGFSALEGYVEKWAITGSGDRAEARLTASETELTAFYAATSTILCSALEYLDQTPIAKFDLPQERLMNLVLSFAHVALAIEVQQSDEVRRRGDRRHMRITKSAADAPPMNIRR